MRYRYRWKADGAERLGRAYGPSEGIKGGAPFGVLDRENRTSLCCLSSRNLRSCGIECRTGAGERVSHAPHHAERALALKSQANRPRDPPVRGGEG